MLKKLCSVMLFITATLSTGCTAYLTRGFRGVADYSDSWVQKGKNKHDVVAAMKECGFTNVMAGYGEDNSNNAFAAKQECMFSKGFKNSEGRGGLCSDPSYRVTLPACQNAPVRPRWE